MRIISGKHKGKNIIAPKKLPVRPTTSFAKEGLFNILSNKINFQEIKLLELFAGTGNIGFEFSSRGCVDVTSVDVNFDCIQFIKSINNKLAFQNKVLRSEAFQYLRRCKEEFNFIFADPPYKMDNISELPFMIFDKKILMPNGLFVLEHEKQTNFKDHPNFLEKREYGKVNFSFFVS